MNTNQVVNGNVNTVAGGNPSQSGHNVNGQPVVQSGNPVSAPQAGQVGLGNFPSGKTNASPSPINQPASGIPTQPNAGTVTTGTQSQLTKVYECINRKGQEGKSEKEIAQELNMNPSMVNQYCRNLVKKGASERREVNIDLFTKRILYFPVALIDGKLPQISPVPQSAFSSERWKKTLDFLQAVYGKDRDQVLEEALLDYTRKMQSNIG